MSITASEARKALLPLIKKVNDDHEAIEIVSKHGNAVLVSAEDYAALRDNALGNINVSERELIDPDAADPADPAAGAA